MTNSNLRETIRTAFQNSGLTVADFDNELSSTLDDVFDELYKEEADTTTCGIDCMSLPWDSFFDNIIFPYITTQIPSCGSLSALRQEDDLYTTLRTETKNFFVSIGDVHSLFTNPKNEDTLNSLLSALIH
nr:MAG TPA: hypothetical protein [Caudoviricetes sp.]